MKDMARSLERTDHGGKSRRVLSVKMRQGNTWRIVACVSALVLRHFIDMVSVAYVSRFRSHGQVSPLRALDVTCIDETI